MTPARLLLRRPAALSMTLVLGLALGAMLSACSAAQPSGSGDGGTVSVVNGVVELSAANLVFNAAVIEAPAGEPFDINFTNDDTVPHNISVYVQEGGDEIVKGEIIDAGLTTRTPVSALEPGTYYFQCDLHPEMKGTLVVEG